MRLFTYHFSFFTFRGLGTYLLDWYSLGIDSDSFHVFCEWTVNKTRATLMAYDAVSSA